MEWNGMGTHDDGGARKRERGLGLQEIVDGIVDVVVHVVVGPAGAIVELVGVVASTTRFEVVVVVVVHDRHGWRLSCVPFYSAATLLREQA